MSMDTSKLAKDACLVQDACNPSGVILSFAKHLRENDLPPDDPVCVMFASKIACMAGQYSSDTPGLYAHWSEIPERIDLCAKEMQGLNTDAKSELASFQLLAKELRAQTKCGDHNITSSAFRTCFNRTDWTGLENARESFRRNYLGAS
jgi:hypothetical protein